MAVSKKVREAEELKGMKKEEEEEEEKCPNLFFYSFKPTCPQFESFDSPVDNRNCLNNLIITDLTISKLLYNIFKFEISN